MPAYVVHANETRRTETPNAVMTTLASPTLSNTRDFSVWQVDLGARARGPVHMMDSEQVWTMLAGDASCVGRHDPDHRWGDASVRGQDRYGFSRMRTERCAGIDADQRTPGHPALDRLRPIDPATRSGHRGDGPRPPGRRAAR